ncbi:MAG: PilZ domain-containing protein [Desulfobacterales bacterium]|nr:PilZ domain-containing protein [Desulfobacterales bacterium]
MPEQNQNEKRRGTRVTFDTKIILRLKNSEIHVKGNSKDMSLKGVFISTQEDIPLEEKCLVEIWLTGMTEEIKLQMNGRIIRKDPFGKGLAVYFDSMDIDSYMHLKNIVRYNSPNPDDIS